MDEVNFHIHVERPLVKLCGMLKLSNHTCHIATWCVACFTNIGTFPMPRFSMTMGKSLQTLKHQSNIVKGCRKAPQYARKIRNLRNSTSRLLSRVRNRFYDLLSYVLSSHRPTIRMFGKVSCTGTPSWKLHSSLTRRGR